MPEVNDVKALPGLSKHTPKQCWKFYHSLLTNDAYIDTVRPLIIDVKQRNTVRIYHANNLNNISDEHIEFVIDNQLF